jgi:hypothetical protein
MASSFMHFRCMLLLDVAYVLSECCVCCNRYTRMLQVFCLYVAYVAMTIHVCCKCMFHMFQLFQTYVASVLSRCCICCTDYTVCCKCIKCFRCFKCMLQMFHLDVAYVALALHTCCKCMFQMFQVFQTYVAKYFYLDVAYVAVAIHICCKRMFVNVSFVSDVCCSECFTLQVLHDRALEVGVDGSGPSCMREAKWVRRPTHACAGAYVLQQQAGRGLQARHQQRAATTTTAAARGQVRQQRAGGAPGVACMRCGPCPGKVGGGGMMHAFFRWSHAFREVRRLRRFLPHAEGARQARGRAVGTLVWMSGR